MLAPDRVQGRTAVLADIDEEALLPAHEDVGPLAQAPAAAVARTHASGARVARNLGDGSDMYSTGSLGARRGNQWHCGTMDSTRPVSRQTGHGCLFPCMQQAQ